MALRAKLDHDLVYWGPEEVAELGPDDVAAPDEAIRPGAYRWVPEKKDGPAVVDVGHWVPLEPKLVKVAEGAPTLEQAFYDLLTIGPDAPRVKAWGEWFEKSIDGRVL